MTTHLSVRLPWHDSGWNGHVCKNPKMNGYCVALDYIREKMYVEIEQEEKGKRMGDLKADEEMPACRQDANVFGLEKYSNKFIHPVEYWRIPSTYEEILPHSFVCTPYRWMMVENYDQLRREERLGTRNLRDDEKTKDGKDLTWISDSTIQRALLESFWNKIDDGKSLVVFYTNASPIEEYTKRLVIGIGRVLKKGKLFDYPDPTEPGSPSRPRGPYRVWQRIVQHAYPEQGFRIPYQEYISQGLNPEKISLEMGDDPYAELKYVGEHVSETTMISIVEQLGYIIETIISDIKKGSFKTTENWTAHKQWLDLILGELWHERGKYPGIGSVLDYLGFGNGILYQKEILIELENGGIDTLDHVLGVLSGQKRGEERYIDSFSKCMKRWTLYSQTPSMKRLLIFLMRMDVTTRQVERIIKDDLRHDSGIKRNIDEICNNPYLIVEEDQGLFYDTRKTDYDPPISLEIIDQAMVPSFMISDSYTPDDDRRIRALLITLLSDAALEQGHTIMPVNDILMQLRLQISGSRRCVPDKTLMLLNEKFYNEKVLFIGDKKEFVCLKELRDDENLISTSIMSLISRNIPEKSEIKWDKVLFQKLGPLEQSRIGIQAETAARKEKSYALGKLFSNNFMVLTGKAGTGKTTVISIFLEYLTEIVKEAKQGILVLAPTGKARVRIKRNLQGTGIEPKTIHQYLMEKKWMDENFNFKRTGGIISNVRTLIVDETSMLPVDLFATLLRSINISKLKRLILVGDPNQLPPIGPGRAFDDIIKWLEQDTKRIDYIQRLNERVRQRDRNSICLRLADGFLKEETEKDLESLFVMIEQKRLPNDSDLDIRIWEQSEDLETTLVNVLKELGISNKSEYLKSIGVNNQDYSKVENWQILTPTRRDINSGSLVLNDHLQNKILGDDIRTIRGRKGQILGKAQDFVKYSKIIQIRNRRMDSRYVANGEIGVVLRANRGCLDVVFSSQPNEEYRYWVGSSKNSVDTNIELAYAITIHKSQGSDFEQVILAIPKSSYNISMEMLYTALTRSRTRTYLLIQNGIETILKFRNRSYSETDIRNTYLFELAIGTSDEDIPYVKQRIHKTINGFLVKSKSEVIIANELINAGLDIDDSCYERRLYSKSNPHDYKLPDFTIEYMGRIFYWEHLGMLGNESYRKSWERKEHWYKENGYWDNLIISRDGLDGSINSQEIQRIIQEKILIEE